MAQGLSEALGQRGPWQVNCHACPLPETTAGTKPCLAPALCCLQSAKPKPAVDLILFSSLNWAVTKFAGVACVAARQSCTTLQDWATPHGMATLANLAQQHLPQN